MQGVRYKWPMNVEAEKNHQDYHQLRRLRFGSQATPIASIASIASILPRIPSVRRKDFRQVITDISDITVTSETFEAGIDGRVSLIWDIAQLIMPLRNLQYRGPHSILVRVREASHSSVQSVPLK